MQHLKEQLIRHKDSLSSQVATLGFDGFIDSIIGLVNKQQPAAVNSMEAFGNYILNKKGSNFSLEIQERSTKAGGNMPNMAGALAKLGLIVNCVGTLGFPQVDPLFKQSLAECRTYSFAAPGTSQAIEFSDGKMMLAGMQQLDSANWQLLTQRIPVATLIALFDNSRLAALLNWGELSASTSIWQGLLQEVLPFCTPDKQKIFFVDLSDCSSRSKEDMLAALALLQDFSRHRQLILSLNKNECSTLYQQLFDEASSHTNLQTMAEKIFRKIQPHTLVVHQRASAMAFREKEFEQLHSPLVDNPVILTGAGDHFNAGFCAAQLMGLNLTSSLALAHLLAGCYIKKGQSPDWEEILKNTAP